LQIKWSIGSSMSIKIHCRHWYQRKVDIGIKEK
jgi:hypothetical protein